MKELMYLRWNYLCYPDISDEDKTTLAAWIKEMRIRTIRRLKQCWQQVPAIMKGLSI